MDPSVFIDGTPVTELGEVKSIAFSRTYAGGQGGGFRDARVTLDLEPGFQHPSLRLAAPVEVRHGAQILGLGSVVSIDRNTWEIVVDGIVRKGEDYESRTSAGVPAGLATGLPAAVTRGLPWKIDPDLVLPGDVVGQQMQSVTDALNDLATQQQKSWLIDVDTVRMISDPTTPTLQLLATDNPNSSTDGIVSVVTAKYAGAVDESGNPALISYVSVALDGAPTHVERTIDLTSNGAMTVADATAQAKAALTSGATSPLTESVQVAPGTLFTAVGLDLTDLECTVREGQMVRQLDWVNPDGSAGMYRDWIIGEVAWSKNDDEDPVLILTPVGANAATLAGTIIDLRQGVDTAKSTGDKALAVGTPDYLQSLITATSVTTLGTLPASAAVGDLAVIDGKTYVCTLAYTSGGTLTANWVQATDPRTIALISATATAVFKADNANAAAATAQASADGKNTIHYNASAPASSYPGVIGDTVFVFSGSFVTAQYKLTAVSGGTYTWSPVQLTSAVIANLDAGKITTGVLSAIDISGVNISGSTITGGSFSTAGANPITMAPYGSSFGADVLNIGGGGQLSSNGSNVYFETSGSMLSFTGPSLFYIGQDQGLQVDHAANFYSAAHFYSTVTADGDITANGGRFVAASLPTTTIAPNCLVSLPSGVFFTTSGSSRAVKYDIEPAEIDEDIDALEKCGVFAYHYRTDPEARLMIGVILEDMLEQGLRRYVDFDENDEPLQPSWNQISALLIAAHQRNVRRLSSLEARLTALEAS